MPTLILDRLLCVEDTPEWTPDEVYLLLIVAQQGGLSRLQALTLAPAAWQRLSRGTRQDRDLVVEPQWAPDTLVLATLLERDGREDFGPGPRLDHVLESLETVRQLFASLQRQPRVYLAAQLLAEMDLAVARAVGDDCPLGHAQLVEPGLQEPVELSFGGRGGQYRLRFALR